MSGAPDGRLLHNIVLFGRLLRGLGLDVTPVQILDLVAALHWIDLSRKEDVKESARAILVRRPEQLTLFDDAFDLFWQTRKERLPRLELPMSFQPKQAAQRQRPYAKDRDDSPIRDEPQVEQIRTYSEVEILRQKDFAQMSAVELAQVKRLMQEMRWQLAQRRSRRHAANGGDQLDMRRTFRHNMRYGGELLHWVRRRRKLKPRSIVLICDISGSMERYARVLLQFLYVVANSLGAVETFVFSTRLTHLSRPLKRRSLDDALRRAAASIHDWAGGTRIGEAIRTFNYQWARRVLGRGAVVLIISDGWDRGDPHQLGREVERLQRSCHRLIWLNPLLGSPGYQPLTRGMQAALPYVDDFLPVHNLVSLEQLAEVLATL
jgi:uncharacterized protein with von Willebrand factor type A (vWA) domain